MQREVFTFDNYIKNKIDNAYNSLSIPQRYRTYSFWVFRIVENKYLFAAEVSLKHNIVKNLNIEIRSYHDNPLEALDKIESSAKINIIIIVEKSIMLRFKKLLGINRNYIESDYIIIGRELTNVLEIERIIYSQVAETLLLARKREDNIMNVLPRRLLMYMIHNFVIMEDVNIIINRISNSIDKENKKTLMIESFKGTVYIFNNFIELPLTFVPSGRFSHTQQRGLTNLINNIENIPTFIYSNFKNLNTKFGYEEKFHANASETIKDLEKISEKLNEEIIIGLEEGKNIASIIKSYGFEFLEIPSLYNRIIDISELDDNVVDLNDI